MDERLVSAAPFSSSTGGDSGDTEKPETETRDRESVSFYDVKERCSVQVPRDQVTKTLYSRRTRANREQIRYALRGRYKGRNLTKFIGEADYQAFIESSEGQDSEQSDGPTPLSCITDRVNGLIKDLVSEPKLLHNLDKDDFERLVAEVLRNHGYNVQRTHGSNDE